MKNIEKFAIDAVLTSLKSEIGEEIQLLQDFKKQFEDAKKNFQKAANDLQTKAKAKAAEISEELSEEGCAALEQEITSILTVPFKLK